MSAQQPKVIAAIEYRKWLGVYVILVSAAISAFSIALLALTSSPSQYILGVGGLLFFGDLLVIHLRRVASSQPVVIFSTAGVNDPFRMLGVGQLSWNDVESVRLVGSFGATGPLEIRTRAQHASLVRLVPFRLRGRERTSFRVPRRLLVEPERALAALAEFGPEGVVIGSANS